MDLELVLPRKHSTRVLSPVSQVSEGFRVFDTEHVPSLLFCFPLLFFSKFVMVFPLFFLLSENERNIYFNA